MCIQYECTEGVDVCLIVHDCKCVHQGKDMERSCVRQSGNVEVQECTRVYLSVLEHRVCGV